MSQSLRTGKRPDSIVTDAAGSLAKSIIRELPLGEEHQELTHAQLRGMPVRERFYRPSTRLLAVPAPDQADVAGTENQRTISQFSGDVQW